MQNNMAQRVAFRFCPTIASQRQAEGATVLDSPSQRTFRCATNENVPLSALQTGFPGASGTSAVIAVRSSATFLFAIALLLTALWKPASSMD
jgi:hypothetical protein